MMAVWLSFVQYVWGCLIKMKKEIDKDGRTITNKEELRDLLQTIAKRYELIDVTIKVYDTIFFLFFQMKLSLAPQEVIDAVQEKITLFSKWDEDYVITGVEDLQE